MKETYQKKVNSLAQRLKKQNRESRLKIESFTAMSDMPSDGIWNDIKELYGPKDTSQTERFLATLLNGIATERKSRFFLSKGNLSDMLEADPNVNRGPVNQAEFNSFMAIQQKNKVIACIKPPDQLKKESGIYRLIDMEILERLGLDISSPQDSPQMPSQKTSSETYPEYEDENEASSENEAVNEAEKSKSSVSIVQNRPSGSGSSDDNKDSINTLNQIEGMKDQLKDLERDLMLINDEALKEKANLLREEIRRKQKAIESKSSFLN
jgi:hypothetical protein